MTTEDQRQMCRACPHPAVRDFVELAKHHDALADAAMIPVQETVERTRADEAWAKAWRGAQNPNAWRYERETTKKR